MKKLLRTLFIVGIVVFILDYLGYGFDPITMILLMVLMPITITTLKYVNLIEDPEKHLTSQAPRYAIIMQNPDEARRIAAHNSSYTSFKRNYTIIIIIFSLALIGYAIFRIIDKANRGLFIYGRLTFTLGIILFTTMIIILIITLRKKEQLFAKENIRKNAYLYLNALMSLVLIAK